MTICFVRLSLTYFNSIFLQEAATAISEEVSILRTDETDSRVIMSGQREVSTALIVCHISTLKFP